MDILELLEEDNLQEGVRKIGTTFAFLQKFVFISFYVFAGTIIPFTFNIYSSTHWYYVFSILIPAVLILGGCGLLKFGINKWDEEFETEELKRCERDLKIGLGGIVLCGYTAQVFFISGDPNSSFTSWRALAICHLSSLIFLSLFVAPSTRKVNYKENEDFTTVSVICEFIFLFLSRLIYEHYQPDKTMIDSKVIVMEPEIWKFLMPFLITMIYTTVTRDFLLVLMGEVRKYAEKEEQKKLRLAQATKEVVAQIKQEVIQNLGLSARPKSSECQLCLLEYSETQIPRMLRQCGHTVCQQCVEKLLKQSNHIACPFCREVTVVNGSATKLPKNYTVLEMILERKSAYIV